jgi:hypothetical protein
MALEHDFGDNVADQESFYQWREASGMNTWNRNRSVTGWMSTAVVLTLGVILLGGFPAYGDDIGIKLSEVPEGYARAYSSPFIYAHGPNQNSNLYSTAEIPWGVLKFGIGLKFMGTNINETDQSFRLVYEDVDLGEFDDDYAGMTGDIVMQGPTIFGSTDDLGTIEIYHGGALITEPIETISGIVDTRWVPLAAPEGYIGGLFGLKAMIRWLPTISNDDFGKVELFGYGLQWSTSGLLKDFPVDMMVGFFNQSLDIYGEVPGYEGGMLTEASSLYLAGSYDWPALTLYGGFALESSEMDVYYSINNPDLGTLDGTEVTFTEEGRQENRFTLGVTFDIIAKLNLEMAHGDFTTYSAGLMFGN